MQTPPKRVLCILHDVVHSVVVGRIAHMSWVPGANNSPQPNFQNDSPGSAGLGNANTSFIKVACVFVGLVVFI